MNGLSSVYGNEVGETAPGGLAAMGEVAGIIPKVPDKKFKAGGITATVWKGVSPEGRAYFNVQLGRSYKDKDNSWKTTSSFRESDVPKAVVLLQKAYEYVITQQTNSVLN